MKWLRTNQICTFNKNINKSMNTGMGEDNSSYFPSQMYVLVEHALPQSLAQD